MLEPEELKLCAVLGEVYNRFVALPVMHPADRSDFCDGIHVLQNLIMQRSAVRSHPEFFGYPDISLQDWHPPMLVYRESEAFRRKTK